MNEPIDQATTDLIAGLRQGSDRSATTLWSAYFDKLMRLARHKLRDFHLRHVSEEDIALSAFKSVALGMQANRFASLNDRQDLWKLLVVVARRKVNRELRRHFAAKRPDAHMRAASEWDQDSQVPWEEMFSQEPTQEFAVQFADELEQRMEQLANEELQQIAMFRLAGCTNQEIAERLGTYERRVYRKLELIRSLWWDWSNGSSTSANQDEAP